LFVSSDPSKAIPIGLLERCIKLTNEPPEGLKANMKRAFTFFNKEDIEDKDPKIKTILFALCYFHSVMLERRKFGPKGWNMRYPFSVGDLRDSAIVLNNYMETNAASGKIPWDDLKYIFGDIMYGGHIVDDWDRIFCSAYLDNLMNDTLLEDDEAELFPYVDGKGISFRCPAALSYEKYLEHIDTECPPETPLAFGLDPNTEIDFRTQQCLELFRVLQEVSQGSSAGGGGSALQECIQAFMVRVNDETQLDANKLNIDDISSKLGDEARTPYQNAFLQECEYMNILIRVIVSSLAEIELAFKGELTMTEKMESLMASIFLNQVPDPWAKYGFPSTRGLGSWLDNVRQRLDQLNAWKDDPVKKPAVTFVNRLFNPQSFLTAIKQVYSRETGLELNVLTIQTDVLKKIYWEQDLPPCKEGQGAYVFGFHVEGARWDLQAGQIEESKPKKPFSVMPVVNCRAAQLPADGKRDPSLYYCPAYMTEQRGKTYVFTAQLKTKAPPQRWILAGVAIILDVEGVSDAYAPGKEVPILN
jgi:dynein heavy chain